MKGILFKPDMIKASVEGRKTQTRRVSGLKEINKEPDNWETERLSGNDRAVLFCAKDEERAIEVKPRYRVSEVVYIKEAWCRDCHEGQTVCYKLDGEISEQPDCPDGRWRSPMFLKASDARYFIKITGVRAERLQEITGNDCLAEGIKRPPLADIHLGEPIPKLKRDYFQLWDSINKHPYDWQSNPWVWVYEFKMVEKGGG